MKTLSFLLKHIDYTEIIGDEQYDILSVEFDSRQIHQADNEKVTSIYIAQRGTQADGHLFIPQAIGNGAKVIICEQVPQDINPSVTYIRVNNSSIALGKLASAYYDFPSQKLKLVGITGTNGKTTTVTLLHQLFMSLGYPTGLISTIVNKIENKEIPSTHTTPDALALNKLLAQMVDAGCEFCFMEVSSHAICQYRIEGLSFVGAIFSNITHDHLDFHKTFSNYIQAKKAFFDHLPKTAFALTNMDDKNGRVMVQNSQAVIKTYSLNTDADMKGVILDNGFEGLHLKINGQEVFFHLSGKFNAYNLLAIYGTAVSLGVPSDEVLLKMSALTTAEGRFEVIRNGQGGVAIVDYAHTPDALQNVLSTIHDITQNREEILTVVGCGGNRDALKRPIMAEIACRYSHRVILTSDNPRLEDPNQILCDMEAGIPIESKQNVLIIENRHEAIKTASMMMRDHGVILIAGKGHEKYQDIQGIKHHFDDTEEIKNNWNINK
ncbi:MAG: UDP-N-acetylmuramoyl-L-alanyl-D-glutamate--2,6-diaminopimelate ligase [Bacteroidales bacterium]|nr:UDP-N-acetylmuramoyl-L-alanyl-D-glutamate--2,6-diaminopimelate ligase [Bacteroidales bacterium]MDD4395615.1 UDP-N-acetylmuramoyl-L-alanyl-D-glutamate--2,6-diaminopimelate ligase [Bacteroidales bacterium]